MKVNKIYPALETLNQGKSQEIDNQTTQFMQERGLVAILDYTSYLKMQSDASQIDSVSRDINSYRSQIENDQTQENILTKKLNSSWENFWSSKSDLKREQAELDKIKSKLQKANQELLYSQTEKQRLEKVNQDLESYVRISEGYVKLTAKAYSIMPRIKSRLYRIADKDYNKFNDEINQIDNKITSSVERLNEVYEKLANEYVPNENFILTAQQLAKYNGNINALVSRFKQISTLLDKEDWTSYKKAPIAAGLVGMIEYTPKEVARRIVAAHNALVRIGYTDDYNTAGAAFAIVKRKADDNMTKVLKDIETTFTKMKKTGWTYSSINAPIAAHLMFMRDDSVQRAHKIYKTLIANELPNSRETSILSTILLNAQNEPKELVDRTKKIFDILGRSWSGIYKYAIPAGVLAMMPGTPEELIETLQIAYKKLEEKDFRFDTLSLATGVLADSYFHLQNTGFFQKIYSDISSSNVASRYVGDDHTRSTFGWAVAGDLLDNGSLDISGGFIAGALLGSIMGSSSSDYPGSFYSDYP
ncbi:DUF4003 family protein [Candidatus Pacearchaeota archaeon]|nr:DUF4003 family protein [Candidatus Pacearchaeota archaeon]